jgi:hypothetical protein
VVGVLGEPGVDLGHAREQPLLVGGVTVPRAHVVTRGGNLLGHRVNRRQLRALRHDATLDHARQHPLAVCLIAVVELALVLVDELLRRVVRRMVRTGTEEHVPRLVGLTLLPRLDHLQSLVRQVLGEVIALLGHVGLIDVAIVLGEARIPVVRLAADEAIETVKAPGKRPVALRRAHVEFVDRDVVVLADPVGRPPVLTQDLGLKRVLHRNVRVVAGEPGGALGDRGEAVLVMVASCQEAGACRAAKGRGVPLRVAQAVLRETVHRRHLDAPAERRPGGEARVVVEDDQDVRGALGSPARQVRRPVRLGVPDVEVDLTLELLRHDWISCWGRGPTWLG